MTHQAATGGLMHSFLGSGLTGSQSGGLGQVSWLSHGGPWRKEPLLSLWATPFSPRPWDLAQTP